MPEKDGSEDKKSTKSVVNRKQKQFMNQEEQLDLSSVAESFGGQIVGEPVELDEDGGVISIPTAALIAKYGIPLAMTAIGAYGTSRQLQGKPLLPSIKIPNLGIKDKAKKVFGRIKKVLQPNVEKSTEYGRKIKKKFNTKDGVESGTFKYNKNKNKNQNNKNNNKKINKKDAALGFGTGFGTSTAVSTLTKTNNKNRGSRMSLPGTAHNVGRRSNPQ